MALVNNTIFTAHKMLQKCSLTLDRAKHPITHAKGVFQNDKEGKIFKSIG